MSMCFSLGHHNFLLIEHEICCRLRSLMCFSLGHHSFLLIEHEMCYNLLGVDCDV